MNIENLLALTGEILLAYTTISSSAAIFSPMLVTGDIFATVALLSADVLGSCFNAKERLNEFKHIDCLLCPSDTNSRRIINKKSVVPYLLSDPTF